MKGPFLNLTLWAFSAPFGYDMADWDEEPPTSQELAQAFNNMIGIIPYLISITISS